MKYKLKELLDLPKLQSLLDTLDEIHSLPSAIIDIDGNILTATAWQDICTKFHRANPETEKKCKESDSYITKALDRDQPHVVYKCPFGLVDTATPIIVEGHHLGNVFTGQLFVDPPDENCFEQQARQYGFDERDYLEALRKVPVISEERLLKNLKFLGRFAEMLAMQGMQHKRQLDIENVLIERNHLIESIINLNPTIIYIYDLVEQKNVYSNEGIQRFLGYTPEEIKELGKSMVHDLMHPADYDVYIKDIIPRYSQAKGREIIRHIYRMKHKEGGWRWLESHECIYKRLPDGSPQQILGVIHDITERKLAEEQLYDSISEYRALFDNMSSGFAYHKAIFDADNTPVDYIFVEINRAFEKHTGLTRNIIGKNVTEVHPGIERNDPDLIGIYGNVALTGETVKLDIYFQPQQHWYSISAYSPKRGFFVTIFDDITERKNAEKRAEAVRQRLDLATQSANLGIWDWDITGNNMLWDDRMLELYGLTPETFSGGIEAWQNGLHPEDRDRTIEGCQAVLREGKDWEADFRVVHPDGKIKHIKGNGIVLRNSDGDPVRMLGINFDISEHRNLEQQLRQAQKMEAVGVLAGGVAHDFNNILQGIIGYSSMIKQKSKEELTREFTDEILALSGKAADLTRSLLAYSRKQVLHIKPVDLNDVVFNTQKLLARLIGEDIILKVKFHNRELTAMADASQIQQGLLNLAINARDAMQRGGELYVETSHVDVGKNEGQKHSSEKAGQYAVISVTDTGEGIDKEDLEHIFEPFYTTKEVGKGTGLGLAMVYGIVKQHDGFINVYSEKGLGTTFKIYLPLQMHLESATVKEAPEETTGGTERVLLIEDDPSVRKIVKLTLEERGYQVEAIEDPEEGLELYRARGKEIDMVILDVIMPKKNGKAVFDEMKKINPKVKALFISGYPSDYLSRKGFTEVEATLLMKPIHPDVLLMKVRETLSS